MIGLIQSIKQLAHYNYPYMIFEFFAWQIRIVGKFLLHTKVRISKIRNKMNFFEEKFVSTKQANFPQTMSVVSATNFMCATINNHLTLLIS